MAWIRVVGGEGAGMKDTKEEIDGTVDSTRAETGSVLFTTVSPMPRTVPDHSRSSANIFGLKDYGGQERGGT